MRNKANRTGLKGMKSFAEKRLRSSCGFCETKPTVAAGAVCRVPARAYEETPCGVTTNGVSYVKQSQRVCANRCEVFCRKQVVLVRQTLRNKANPACRDDGGHSPPYGTCRAGGQNSVDARPRMC